MNIVPILCLLLFVIVAKADVLEEDSRVESESGSSLAGPNGIESSFLDSINPGHRGEPIMGRFVYSGEGGQQFDVFYFADVYGYQAQGRLVMTSHPLAKFINNFNKRITLKGQFGSVEQ